MNRRGFIGAILAAGLAPAIVRVASLMPVRGIVLPSTEETIDILYGYATPQLIAREGLQILKTKISLRADVGTGFSQIEGCAIAIRRPQHYLVGH